VTFWNFYFRFFPGTIKKEQVVEFLSVLVRQLPNRLLIIWDGLAAHRSKRVRDYVDSLEGHIQLEFLPAYAPELNPVEYAWGYLKGHKIANLYANTLDDVRRYATNRLNSTQRRPRLIWAFWKQAELAL